MTRSIKNSTIRIDGKSTFNVPYCANIIFRKNCVVSEMFQRGKKELTLLKSCVLQECFTQLFKFLQPMHVFDSLKTGLGGLLRQTLGQAL